MQRSLGWALTAGVIAAVLALALTVLGGVTTGRGDDPAGRQAAAADPPESAGVPAPTPTLPSTPSATPTTPGDTEATSEDAEAASEIDVRSARLADVQAEQEPAPVALDVETIGIDDAPIDPVGILPDGSMEIPEDIRRIGWYEYGPSPGEAEGSAVITAHIDSRTQGRGVFYYLDELAPGERVEVTMSDGSTRAFEVFETRQIPKVDLPTGDLFRRDGAPVLALITCGGEFDESSRHYQDNIVVLATPIG